MEQEHASSIVKSVRVPWNKGKLVGAKAPLRPGRTASTLNSRLKLRLSIRHLRLHYDTQTSCP